MWISSLFDMRGVGGIALGITLLVLVCIFFGIRQWVLSGSILRRRIDR